MIHCFAWGVIPSGWETQLFSRYRALPGIVFLQGNKCSHQHLRLFSMHRKDWPYTHSEQLQLYQHFSTLPLLFPVHAEDNLLRLMTCVFPKMRRIQFLLLIPRGNFQCFVLLSKTFLCSNVYVVLRNCQKYYIMNRSISMWNRIWKSINKSTVGC